MLVAALGCLGPFMFPREGYDRALAWSRLAVLVWIVLVFVAVIIYRKRGLWVLLGLPLAFYQPFMMVILVLACSGPNASCP